MPLTHNPDGPRWNRLYTGRTQPRRFPGVETAKREHSRTDAMTDPDTPTCAATVPTIGVCGTPITGIQVSERQRLVGCIRCYWTAHGLCWECGQMAQQTGDVLCWGCRITRETPTRPAGNKKKRGRPRQ